MKLYRATSLDDIAKQFRDKAKICQENMERSIDRNKRDMISRELITWNEAADMLENMELVEK